jgi:hypothetical protein
MCTFFARYVALAVLLTGCSRHPARTTPSGAPAPRADTLFISVPVVRLTPGDSAEGSAALDSATLALLERRVMSRIVSVLRAETHIAAGNRSAGIPPVKDAAPTIRHGLLGTITFTDDGSVDETSRDRITAVARMLREIESPVELRASADLSSTSNLDVAMARARRVYLDLIAENRELAERDVAITITGIASATPIKPAVEIYWKEP